MAIFWNINLLIYLNLPLRLLSADSFPFLSFQSNPSYLKTLHFSFFVWRDNIHKFLPCNRCPSSVARTNRFAELDHRSGTRKFQDLFARTWSDSRFLPSVLFFQCQDILDIQLGGGACDCSRSEASRKMIEAKSEASRSWEIIDYFDNNLG